MDRAGLARRIASIDYAPLVSDKPNVPIRTRLIRQKAEFPTTILGTVGPIFIK